MIILLICKSGIREHRYLVVSLSRWTCMFDHLCQPLAALSHSNDLDNFRRYLIADWRSLHLLYLEREIHGIDFRIRIQIL